MLNVCFFIHTLFLFTNVQEMLAMCICMKGILIYSVCVDST